MKKKKLLALAPSCLIAMLSGSNVFANVCPSDFYVGFDVLKTSFSTKEGYGRNVFAKNPTAFNAFVGYKLPRNFFVEAGYEWTVKKGRSVDGVDLVNFPGLQNVSFTAGQLYTNTETKIKIVQPYLGVGISYPLSFCDKTTISGLVGISATRVKAQFKAQFYGPINYDDNFSKHKLSSMAKININHEVTKRFYVHLAATFHRLTNFKLQGIESNMELRMKNSYAVGAGITYRF